MAKPISLIAGFMTVGLWTLISRVLGFVRDILIAAWLGTGPVAEAFLIAFSLPNMFRRFFAEGAFNMAFVPMFSKKVESGDGPLEFARDAFTAMIFILGIFTAIAMIAMPALVLAMASGFADDVRFDLAVSYGRVAFPYIFFISLAALLSGVLNANGRFLAAAAAPVLLNVIFITILVIGASVPVDTVDTVPGIANETLRIGAFLVWAVPVAGMAQLALVWVAASRAGFRLLPRRPRLTPDLKRLAMIAAPAALAGGVVQVNLLVGRQVASFFDGAIAWLSYADRLYQLPLGVVGIAIGIVLLPQLSRRLQAEDEAGGQAALSRAAEMSLALSLPAAIALAVVPVTLVTALFERGAFTAEDTRATALATAVYGLGLPAFVLQKVFQPLFFAREDTKRPFYYALVALVVNAGLAIGLAPMIGFLAAAIGATVAGWAMLALLWWGSRSMGVAATFDDRFRHRLWRIIAAAAVMGVVITFVQGITLGWMMTPSGTLAALLSVVAAGAVSYGTTGVLIGAFRIDDLKGAVRRQR